MCQPSEEKHKGKSKDGEQREKGQEEHDVVTAPILSTVEKLTTLFVDVTGYSTEYARVLVQTHEGNLEAAFQSLFVTLDSEEKLVKGLLQHFNVSGTASSSSSRGRWRRSNST